MTSNKHKRFKKAALVAVILAALLGLALLDVIPGLSVKAAAAEGAAEGQGGIGYYVRALLPENQMDDSLTYCDLRMRPGQTQALEVEVVNETDQAITVDVAAISASTNRNGIIDYKTPDVRDESLKHPFSQLASLEADSLTIEAGGTALARITLAMPAEEYDGVVLGGLTFTRRPGAAGGEAGGMTLQNVYSYVLGVKLSENDTPVQPRFVLDSVRAETVNYLPAMVHTIRNTQAAIAKGVDVDIVVRDENGNIAGSFKRTGIDMAPNSAMPLGVTPVAEGGADAGTSAAGDGAANGQLQPGEYTSEITLGYGEETFTFSEKFTVGSVEADRLNNTLPTAADGGRSLAPASLWLLVALAAAALTIAGLLIVILVLLRRKNRQPQQAPRRPAPYRRQR